MPNGTSVIRAPDRITAATRRLLRERVREQIEAGATRVILSCEATRSIDSSGLGLLCTLRRYLESYGGTLYLSNLSDELRTMLHVTALDRTLTILDEDEDVGGRNGDGGTGRLLPGPPLPHLDFEDPAPGQHLRNG